jgi:chemotaxis protein MotB
MPDAYPLLDRLGALLLEGGWAVEIIGHTDNRSAKEKGFQSNWELSVLMATSVLKYWVLNCGLNAQKITAYGCGGSRPIASNETRESRAKNRRIELVIEDAIPDYVKRIYERKSRGIFSYKKFDFRIF